LLSQARTWLAWQPGNAKIDAMVGLQDSSADFVVLAADHPFGTPVAT
jgi:hypothetical protein